MIDEKATALLFADVAGSTQLYRRLGDRAAEAAVRQVLHDIQTIALRHRGRVVKNLGDGAMCELPDAAAAAAVAVALQERTVRPLDTVAASLQLRIGFCTGVAIQRDGDLYGDCVNLAARLCEVAKAGQILTTEECAALLPEALRKASRLYDVTPLKGIDQPVRIAQVLWGTAGHTEMFQSQAATEAPTTLHLRHRGVEKVLDAALGTLLIGRALDCDWTVQATRASRHHLKLSCHRGKFLLTDQSSNGTFVRHADAPAGRTVFVRNESFTLVGEGAFGLGCWPEDEADRFEFRVE
jgi:class 3 adenylate cyclase